MSKLDNAELTMWKYLLEHGQICRRSYYGRSCSIVKTEECRQAIKDSGVDWNKTKAVSDNREDQFVGTFDSAETVTYLSGTLVTNNGEEWEWDYEYDEPINILKLVSHLLNNPFEES